MIRIGLLVNPIAGMGGRVGLKGTDGVVEEAIRLGARPSAHSRAEEMLRALRQRLDEEPRRFDIRWLTCAGAMGADALRAAGFEQFEVVYTQASSPTRRDTEAAIAEFLERGADLLLFCGGDGTARDICSVARQRVPMLGIPAGVKMYSGVFGASAIHTAEILVEYLAGRLAPAKVDILDLDEDRYRRGEWAARLYDVALTPFEPTLTQATKMLITDAGEESAKAEIAEHLFEAMQAEPQTLFVLGPGSTVQSLGSRLGVDKTLLGIDAVAGGQLVGKDLNERQLLDRIGRYPRVKLVLSPIGAQGFVLGRGNLPLSPEVIGRIGGENLIVVSTPAKLARTPLLRFDTGDAALDAALARKGFLPVVIGYHLSRLVRVAA
jgi:predicted polyphosphate/ATP-dependent NAD kinase